MKWKQHKHGNDRLVKKFLLFPTCIRGECRWLENANIIQMWHVRFQTWTNQWWADEELVRAYENAYPYKVT